MHEVAVGIIRNGKCSQSRGSYICLSCFYISNHRLVESWKGLWLKSLMIFT
jgi:hypothetical protein